MDTPTAAEPIVEARQTSFWRNLSLVWLVPVVALAVTLFIAWQSWAERGTRIEIHFENAAGVTADETLIRYRDVNIGVVEDVAFAEDLTEVIVHARIDRAVAAKLPENAEFWVVRPEVSASGISGLSTVLSGVYIQAAFEPATGRAATSFKGLKETPLVMPGMKGTRVTLRTEDGSKLTAGAPIYFQGIEVGKIEAPQLAEDGNAVTARAFIAAPHDRRLTTATRFWQTSGFSVNFGPQGLNLSVGSVAGILRGGLSFDTVYSGGAPIEAGHVFDLYESEEDARSSAFNKAVENPIELAVEFQQSVAGLAVGSEVIYKGLTIGKVTTLGAFVERNESGQDVILRATLSIDPGRLGLDPGTSEAQTIAFFAEEIDNGLRARLVSKSIFSRTLSVELAELPDAPPAQLTTNGTGAPRIPSVTSDLPDAAATAQGVLNRIDALPVEELMQQAIATLASVESLAGDENLRAAPDAFVGLMNDARDLVGGADAQALPAELRAALADLRKVASDLNTAQAVNRLVTALDAASEAADTVTSTAEYFDQTITGVPGLITGLDQLTAKANSLDVEQFLAAATGFLDKAGALVDQDSTRALPASLTAALDEARAALDDLRAGGAVDNLNATLGSAREAAGAVETAVSGLPDLTARIDALIAEAQRLLAGYGQNSRFNRDTLDTLRELRTTAQALTSLARKLERNPNSILFGR
ncbi:MlaD family protein [Pseudodonghicola sp. IC7]|uniref:MlaD family protein n=2 Tax=Pseudodonghicola flavimaris TaxID=3050036 RepID=A0ABT7EW58_9RHOB|nr:MlaD family protein [Pseudodonghicola flavimaris]